MSNGTSAGSEPTWPTDPDDLGDPVPDGSGGTAFDWEPIEATIVTLRSVPMVLTAGVRTLALSLVWWPRVHALTTGTTTGDSDEITGVSDTEPWLQGERIQVLKITTPESPEPCFDPGVFVAAVDSINSKIVVSRTAVESSEDPGIAFDADIFIVKKDRPGS